MKVKPALARLVGLLAIALIVAGCATSSYYGIYGTVIDENGSPVAGVTIVASGCYGTKSTQTDSSGKWGLRRLIYTSIIHAEHPQMTFYAEGSTFSAWETWFGAEGLDFIATPGYEVSGRIRDENGAPLADVRVELIEAGTILPEASTRFPAGSRPVSRANWYAVSDFMGNWKARLHGTMKVHPNHSPWKFTPMEAAFTSGPAYGVDFSAYRTPFSVAAAISVGGQYYGSQCFALLLKADGAVWEWEYEPGADNSNSVPTPVAGITGGATSISVGGYHNLALSGGTVLAWGANAQGQLGNGTTVDSETPVAVSGLPPIIQIASGGDFSLALDESHSLWAWGSNYSGQLGDGNGGLNKYSPVPVRVSGISDVRAIAARNGHALALKNDGSVWIWGADDLNEMGANDPCSLVPVQVVGLSGIVAIDTGLRHALAVKSDGSVWAWGLNSNGQLGDGSHIDSPTPFKVAGLTDIVSVAAGLDHSAALKSDGSVWTWGVLQLYPTKVEAIPGMTRISCGRSSTFGITAGGVPWSWSWSRYSSYWRVFGPAQVFAWP